MAQIGVQILGDSTSLERAFKRSELAAAEFNGRMNALGQATRGALAGSGAGSKGSFLFGSAAFVGASIAVGALTKSAEAASDLNEQISKSNVVFGESAKVVADWSQSTSTSIGVARRQALSAAATFGSIFVNTGRSKQQAAQFSTTLVNLAGDLASFNNASTDDALTALRSGLAGEIEPLRRFQVFLTEASVAQEALKESGKSSVKQLTQGEKILARYNLILGQTTIQQGDYARTSDGAANQTRTLQANIDDLSTELGGTFLPVVAGSIKVLNELLGGLQRSIVASRKFRDNLKDSHFADGFNSAVDNATQHAGGFLDKLVDITLHVDALKGKLGLGGVGLGNQPVQGAIPGDRGGPDEPKRFTIATPKDADQQAKAFIDRFNAHMKGLDLKFARAQLTKGFKDDLAALNEELASIDRAEKRVGKTFDLEKQRVFVLGQIKTINDQVTASLTKQEKKEKSVTDQKNKQVEAEKKRAKAARDALAAATQDARSLFGTLFQISDQTKKVTATLGGSRGTKKVTVPQSGQEPATPKALLQTITAQNQGFSKLLANISRLVKEGAPSSLIKAAQAGQITPEQVAAIANAPAALRKQIFGQIRRADKLVTRAAKAEINAKTMTVRTNTVTVQGAITSGDRGPGGPSGFVVNGGIHLHGVQNVKQMEAALERQAKKRAGQRRGRTGGKR